MADNPGPQTGREALRWAVSILSQRGSTAETAWLEGRLLLGKVLQQDQAQVATTLDNRLEPGQWQEYRALVEKRSKNVPLQYLLGRQEFMSLSFKVAPGVFIPRGDTEVLVEEALKLLEEKKSPRILDLGTGSGAIALSLAYYLPEARVWAVDISGTALETARENARLLGVLSRVCLLQGDLFAPVPRDEKYNLIVSNPPYISEEEMKQLPPDVRQEPELALRGGEAGLDYYQRIAALAGGYLQPGGSLLLEVGWRQGPVVAELLQRHGFQQVKVLQDWGGRDRVVAGTKTADSIRIADN